MCAQTNRRQCLADRPFPSETDVERTNKGLDGEASANKAGSCITQILRAGLRERVSYLLKFFFFIIALNSNLCFYRPFLIFAVSRTQGPVCFPEAGEGEGLTYSTHI